MRKLLFAALATSIATASCSGHAAGTSALPQMAGPQNAPAAAVDAAPSGWAATQTRPVGSATGRHAMATAPGQAQTITVRVGLKLRNVKQLQAAIRARQIVDPATFAKTYGPSQDQIAGVVSYLHEQGFTGVRAEPNGLIVSGTGPRETIERAFRTHIAQFAGSKPFFGNTTPAYVPAKLAGAVVAVMGLNNAQVAGPPPKRLLKKASPAATAQPCTVNVEGVCPRFYDPPSFQLAYDAASAPTGAKTGVAIMTEGDLSGAIADFRTNEREFGLPQAAITTVRVGAPSTDTSGNDEWTLDMTYSTGMAGAVKQLYLYNFASLDDSDIVMGFNKWVTDDKAPIANASFGGCEVFPYTDGAMLMADEVLVQAAAQGQTMFVSTGDNGAYCNNFVDTNGAPCGGPMAEWPAVSPYVVAVGGTDLLSNPDGSYLGEAAWEAGGGGLSQFEYSPSWENGVQPVGTTPAGYSYRGVPDVAMDASLETGALLYTSGSAVNGSCTPCTTGGTSLASPLAAGVYARMQSAAGNRLGFGAVVFYGIYNANPSSSETSGGPPPTQLVGGFHDILSGSNGAYTGLPRYDYTTGLGSFDVAKTIAIEK
jgi:pseudomonalisin